MIIINHKNIVLTLSLLLFIPLQLSAQEYWAGFSNVKYDGEHFYAVANQQFQVLKLDKSGSVLNSFGKRGKGPQEFSTDDLELLLTDSLLYVLDDKAMTINSIDKKTFKIHGRKVIKKPISNIISYDGNLYGYAIDFEKNNPVETGKKVDVFRPVNQLRNPKASLFEIEDPNPINPFYDGELMHSSNNTVAIAREGKSTVTLFHDDSLYRKSIPYIERISLGEEIKKNTEFFERPMLKVVWKKKIMPEYMLIRSLYVKDQYLYIQVHSYKHGDALFRYDIPKDSFAKIGTLSQGKLVAVDNDTVYTLDNTTISTTTLPDIRSCANETVSFYFNSDAFKEQCTTCTDSFFKWYDHVAKHNIPVQINLEDNSWFGKEEVSAKTLTNLGQWNIWGAVSYKEKCDGCYKSSISVRITSPGSENTTYSFPESISTLKNSLRCAE